MNGGERADQVMDQCRLKFFDLQERALPEVRLKENFAICTWKVKAIFAYFTNQIRIEDRVDKVVNPWGRVLGRPGGALVLSDG